MPASFTKRVHRVALGRGRRRRADGRGRGAAAADQLVPGVGALPVVERLVVGGARRPREPARAVAEGRPLLDEEVPVAEEVGDLRLVRLDVAVDAADVVVDRVDLLLDRRGREHREEAAPTSVIPLS